VLVEHCGEQTGVALLTLMKAAGWRIQEEEEMMGVLVLKTAVTAGVENGVTNSWWCWE